MADETQRAPNGEPWLPTGEVPTTTWIWCELPWGGIVCMERRELGRAETRDIRFAPVHDVSALQARLEAAEAEAQELQVSADLRRRADRRAIERWRAADPAREQVLPDHADLCAWLLDFIEVAEADRDALRAERAALTDMAKAGQAVSCKLAEAELLLDSIAGANFSREGAIKAARESIAEIRRIGDVFDEAEQRVREIRDQFPGLDADAAEARSAAATLLARIQAFCAELGVDPARRGEVQALQALRAELRRTKRQLGRLMGDVGPAFIAWHDDLGADAMREAVCALNETVGDIESGRWPGPEDA